MEGILVFFGVTLLISVILFPILTFIQIRKVRNQLSLLQDDHRKFRRDLEWRFSRLENQQGRSSNQENENPPVSETAVAEEVGAVTVPPPSPEVLPAPKQELPPPIPHPVPTQEEPTALDLLFRRVCDWFCVSGEFATKGTTREFAFVTRWLTRIGTVLLVGCVLYFMKLSVDRGWVGPAGRTASVIVWGTVFVLLGTWMIRKTRYAQVGHALTGLGFFGMYLGFGLGHRFFHPPVIASAAVAFSSLTVVTLLAGVFAVSLPSAGVSVLALLGGYLVPVIAGTPGDSPVRLYLYLILLNVAAAFVAHVRKWSALNFLAAFGAFLMAALWQDAHPKAPLAAFVWSFAFGTVVHLLYLAATVAGSGKRGKSGNAIAWAGLALNAAWYLRWICQTLQGILPKETVALIFLACVAVYILLAHTSLTRGWVDRVTVQLILLFALAYLAFAVYLMVALPNLVPAWCLIAAAAGEAARRTRQPLLGRVGLLLLAAACLLSLWHFAPSDYCWEVDFAHLPQNGYWKAFALRLFRFACVPLTLAAFAWRRWCPTKGDVLPTLLWCAAVAIGFLHLSTEARLFGAAFLPALKGGTVTLAWTFVAAGTLVAGVYGRMKAVRIVALVLLGLAVVKLLLSDTSFLETTWRVLTFGLTGVVLFIGALVYLRFKERFERHDA